MPETATPTYPDLAGKVALVTAGSGGIGSATCQMLAANGVKVAVNGRSPEGIAKVVDAITGEGGVAIAAPADGTDAAAVAALRRRVEAELGPVDILAAFVGGGWSPPGPFAEIDPENWQAALAGCLTATQLALTEFLPGMVERGRGSVITMASSAALTSAYGSSAYAAAKAGVIRLTRAAAEEAGPAGVRVNCLVPHTIVGAHWVDQITEEQWKQLSAGVVLTRLGAPEDVGNATLFLASQAAGWITGHVLEITGGYTMP
jgi:3-oxoacyl-[acyl-carrier protein] reductase